MRKITAAVLMAAAGMGSTGLATEIESPGIHTDITASSKYVYNVYYDADRSVNDAALSVAPDFMAKTKPAFFDFRAAADGLMEQFAANTIQNHFDYHGNVRADVNAEGSSSIRVVGDYKNFSDPSPTETYGRIPRNIVGGEIGARFKSEKGSWIDVSGHYAMESISISSLGTYDATHLYDNNELYGVAQYTNAFLPETNWFLRVTGGSKWFPNKPYGALNDSLKQIVFKNDSSYGIAQAGFIGRLSDKSTIDSAVGWEYRTYVRPQSPYMPSSFTNFDDFNSPVFYVRFVEQVSHRDQLIVGYDYEVQDSYFTNYYLDQDIYIGLVRVLGDQVLILSRFGYDYRSYSLPFRRDDIRITGSVSLKYSLSPTIKLTADLKIDMLSSDVYDNSGPPLPDVTVSPDRPLSYRAGTFGIGVVASY